jgi:hypothetical protein
VPMRELTEPLVRHGIPSMPQTQLTKPTEINSDNLHSKTQEQRLLKLT